jgi:hypothetical protein
MVNTKVRAALIGVVVLSGFYAAKAGNITLTFDTVVNSAKPAQDYDTNPGVLLVAPNYLIGIQPNWAQYVGEQAGPGGMLTFTATDGSGSFTPNGIGSSELYGSTLELNAGTQDFSDYEATSPVAEGTVNWLADSTGTTLTITGVTAITNAVDAGIAGSIETIFLSAPNGNVGANEVDGLTSGSGEEVFNVPLIPAVPEPSALIAAFVAFGAVGVRQLHRRRI